MIIWLRRYYGKIGEEGVVCWDELLLQIFEYWNNIECSFCYACVHVWWERALFAWAVSLSMNEWIKGFSLIFCDGSFRFWYHKKWVTVRKNEILCRRLGAQTIFDLMGLGKVWSGLLDWICEYLRLEGVCEKKWKTRKHIWIINYIKIRAMEG